MTLAFIPQDWMFGLLGGLMIGGAAVLLLLAKGRILGASGILGDVLGGAPPRSLVERLPFLAALIGAPALAVALFGAPETHITGDTAVLVAAGLLVGVGTRMANGCTSGHGVCGMSRVSLRSIVATLVSLDTGSPPCSSPATPWE